MTFAEHSWKGAGQNAQKALRSYWFSGQLLLQHANRASCWDSIQYTLYRLTASKLLQNKKIYDIYGQFNTNWFRDKSIDVSISICIVPLDCCFHNCLH